MAKEKELHVDEHHLAESLVKVAHGAKPFGTVWKALKSGGIILDHVAKEAWPFATALAAQALPKRRLWVVCPDARVQEQVQGELRVWGLPALFFPRLSQMGDAAGLPDPDALAERITALTRFSESMAGKGHGKGKARPGDSGEATGGDEGQPRVLVICADSLDEEVPALHELEAGKMSLQTGMKLDVEALLQDLGSAGYERVPVVTERGQVARRGGIVDVFSWQAEEPLRMEFFDDELESLRSFDIHTQTSVQRFQRMQLLLHSADTTGETTTVRQFIQEQDAVIALEVETLSPATVTITSGARADLAEEDFSTAIFENPLGVFHAGDFVVQEARREQFTRQVEDWRKQKWRVVMFFHNPGERERFEELVGGEWLQKHDLELALGLLHRGFVIPAAKLAVLTGAEVFGRYQNTRRFRGSKLDEAQVLRQARDHLRELREGDLVVHLDYGIGKYGGIEVREGARREEVMVIRYAEDAKVFVPVSQAHLVSRYVGVGSSSHAQQAGRRPLGEDPGPGGEERGRVCRRHAQHRGAAPDAEGPCPPARYQVAGGVRAILPLPGDAGSVEIHRRDQARHGAGEAHGPPALRGCGLWQDRGGDPGGLQGGDGGKQVAVLVPTTVLAQQHLATFKERMSDYPVTVEMLSRLTPAKREKEILKGVKDGTVDIVVGTHRVISKDVQFKQLGLAVIDEEQRFGVKHKERFKQLFRLVDVLTLSATPIPRTLYLGLVGMRDMSTLDTPPPNRHAVQTSVCGYDERIIRDAINKEIERGGQVFFLHNRVMDMEKMKAKLEALSPKARVVIGHGQMDETLLEDVMRRFIAGEADVLLCTTIIESGVDIPNANTIIIDRADRFGLADLYQLRGRVGRGGERAHAYLMLPRDLMTVGDARKRVTAIKQYTALGSGFKIAMRDLEIRGAGNLLGTEQSGHIFAIGFDLYCQMLKSATARLQGRRTPPPMEVSLRVDFLCMSEAQCSRRRMALPKNG
ncbi:helicase-related protein [Verrucomicrobium spinosum]|uniref:helicase-related protein n=1 Tax=Verrucomicrobium spinosum TaxID=2736 RepID=UPI000AA85DC3|nr:helicase-related protein [Verrucomicrobium spinosum]